MQALDVLILLLPVAVNTLPYDIMPVDCADVYRRGFGHSGMYTIYPAGTTSPIQVIQKRKDGTVNFYRGWDQYRSGFGQASGEYWLGLLTQRKKYELRVDLEDFEGAKVHVQYSSFSVDSEHEGYKLIEVASKMEVPVRKSMDEHNGQKFSTFDKDQDTHASNCAKLYLGWWYGECHDVNPNGVYLWGDSIYGIGINWVYWKGYKYSLKAIEMKIRPVE
uniref:Microfibril associated protein 4, tandem duplicate 5 n=1 Tax=Hucho hucho TaxID=62062 RepID=A0A4W5QD88_9TELE